MKTYIELPILFHTAKTTSAANCAVDFKLTDCTVSTVPFFRIDVLIPVKQDGNDYTQVFSGGQMFWCDLNIEEVLDVIDASILNNFIYGEN